MNEPQMRALFLLAGIEVLACWELANQYWPDNEHYAEMRRNSPWWLVRTPSGMVEIGWRKRVISIDWTETPVRAVITEDNVTKDPDLVHAYSYVKALEYLTALRREMDKSAAAERSNSTDETK